MADPQDRAEDTTGSQGVTIAPPMPDTPPAMPTNMAGPQDAIERDTAVQGTPEDE